MDFLEKLNQLMKKNNLNKSTLSKSSGIPYTTIDGWYKKGYDGLKLSTLKKLSNFFNTTLDYWVTSDEMQKPIDSNTNNSNINSGTSLAIPKILAMLSEMTEDELIVIEAFIKTLKDLKSQNIKISNDK